MTAGEGFLNVDLELAARTQAPLTTLAAALSGKLGELFRGRIGPGYRLHLEGAGGPTANHAMRGLLSVIERLDARGSDAWNALAMRDFNIGVELAPGVNNIEFALDADVVARVAALRGRIAFTAYQVSALERATKKDRANRVKSARETTKAKRTPKKVAGAAR